MAWIAFLKIEARRFVSGKSGDLKTLKVWSGHHKNSVKLCGTENKDGEEEGEEERKKILVAIVGFLAGWLAGFADSSKQEIMERIKDRKKGSAKGGEGERAKNEIIKKREREAFFLDGSQSISEH